MKKQVFAEVTVLILALFLVLPVYAEDMSMPAGEVAPEIVQASFENVPVIGTCYNIGVDTNTEFGAQIVAESPAPQTEEYWEEYWEYEPIAFLLNGNPLSETTDVNWIYYSGGSYRAEIYKDVIEALGDGSHSMQFVFYYHGTGQLVQYTGTLEVVDGKVDGKILQFCKRLYSLCLQRAEDEEGAQYWTNMLLSGEKNVGQVIEYFFFGPEFALANHSDEAFVQIAYKTLMGREPDQSGLAYWVQCLKEGNTRRGVLVAFTATPEFDKICENYSISSWGLYWAYPNEYNINLTRFVYRMYEKVLGRGSDVDGLNHWCSEMIYMDMSPYQLASNFMFSEEFVAQGHSNESFVGVLYRAFMGREPEAEGYNYWVEQLNTGARDWRDVFDGFATSQEFMEIAASFGL